MMEENVALILGLIEFHMFRIDEFKTGVDITGDIEQHALSGLPLCTPYLQ